MIFGSKTGYASGQSLTLGTPVAAEVDPTATFAMSGFRCFGARWQAPVCFERSVRESPFWIVLADIQNRPFRCASGKPGEQCGYLGHKGRSEGAPKHRERRPHTPARITAKAVVS